MSDYLTSLAARALGVADVARPRRSMFEPPQGAPELVAASEPVRTSSLGDAPAERSEDAGASTAPPSAAVPEPAPQPSLRVEQPSALETPAKPLRREPLLASARRRTLPATAVPVAAAEVTAEPATSAPNEVEVREPDRAEAAPSVPRRRTDPPFASRPLLAARPPRGTEAVSPPTVRVTIGRVDVRAVVPEQPPEPKRKRRPAPRMSLNEYLSRPGSAGR